MAKRWGNPAGSIREVSHDCRMRESAGILAVLAKGKRFCTDERHSCCRVRIASAAQGDGQMIAMDTRIRQARRSAQLSQAKLAELVGVKRSAVAQWESVDGTHPSVLHLAEIAVATGTCFEWLATGRGSSRSDGEKMQPAVMVDDFARDHTETRMLELMRQLHPRRRELACSIVGLLVGH